MGGSLPGEESPAKEDNVTEVDSSFLAGVDSQVEVDIQAVMAEEGTAVEDSQAIMVGIPSKATSNWVGLVDISYWDTF